MKTSAPIAAISAAALLALTACGESGDPGEQEETQPRYETEEDGRDLIVMFDVAEGGGSATAQDEGWRALTWAVDEYPDHDGRIVLRSFREDGDGMLVNAFYEEDTLEEIDFEEFNKFELWEARDSGMVNPALQD